MTTQVYKKINLKLEIKLDEIYEALKIDNDSKNIGIFTGLSGTSLFLFYYSKLKNNDDASEIAITLIKKCFERINEGYSHTTYCSGITGFGWLLEHLLEEDFIDFDNDELLVDLDDYLLSQMKNDFKNSYYDFLHGGIGYGFYFLKRYKNTSSIILKKKYEENLLRIITYLRDNSEKKGNTIRWATEKNNDDQPSEYNLSLSHGITSITNFLCRLHTENIFRPHVEDMIVESTNFILSCKNQNEDCFSLFPNNQAEDSEHQENLNPKNSRLAWCYGDLGIGITLLNAAKVLNNKIFFKEAIQILTHASLRTAPEKTLVNDAGICHGAFGNALIFNRIFKITNNPIFYEASLFWCNQGLEMSYHKDGNAGYKKWFPEKEEWKKEISLLEGIAGIGLTIINLLSLSDPNWDECLMLS
ncbi:lanthionine synthetase C family protein [Flavobacterium collinsii]|uniref:Nisin biosynthesis protein NisC n=1 Tax=Flavobacterium collinsii TaxID=1114861 RepID=A0ABN7ER14_9FLAO|nr:lanthionine synthetase C family protein [Flavobacterium collinsii]CAA9202998.1 hypothetical protein FLACOL7796_04557 [Flavobacterium collinsii]